MIAPHIIFDEYLVLHWCVFVGRLLGNVWGGGEVTEFLVLADI